MSRAICLCCQAQKKGALTPCLKCGFDPQTPEEQARSLMLSDHDLGETSLEEFTDELSRIDMGQMEKESRKSLRSCIATFFLIYLGIIVLIFVGFYFFVWAR